MSFDIRQPLYVVRSDIHRSIDIDKPVAPDPIEHRSIDIDIPVAPDPIEHRSIDIDVPVAPDSVG